MKIRDFSPRVARSAALLVLAFLYLCWPARAQFTLASLNVLHLGWGTQQNQNTKSQALRNFFAPPGQNPPYDVIALQEVMPQANVPAMMIVPGTYRISISDSLGPGSYKERYAFLVRTNAQPLAVETTTVLGFSRPPSGAMITEGNGRCTWVVNYHAIYGRRILQRLAEVRLIPQVIQWFLARSPGCQRLVIAGDWNLPVAKIVQEIQNQNMQGFQIGAIQPNSQTSLKRNGGLSQPYDHFLAANANGAVAVNINQIEVVFQNNQQARQQWRQSVSDHLPITCTVD